VSSTLGDIRKVDRMPWFVPGLLALAGSAAMLTASWGSRYNLAGTVSAVRSTESAGTDDRWIVPDRDDLRTNSHRTRRCARTAASVGRRRTRLRRTPLSSGKR